MHWRSPERRSGTAISSGASTREVRQAVFNSGGRENGRQTEKGGQYRVSQEKKETA